MPEYRGQPTNKFNVDYSHADTGEDTQHNYITASTVYNLILKSKEGDDIVVHCIGRQPDLHI